jgi:hypothetical protein
MICDALLRNSVKVTVFIVLLQTIVYTNVHNWTNDELVPVRIRENLKESLLYVTFHNQRVFLNSALFRTVAGKDSFLVNEAAGVAERIRDVKASFTPRLRFHPLVDSSATQSPGTLKERFHICDSEIQVIWIRPRIEVIAVCSWIEARQDRAATVEVVPSCTDATACLLQQVAIEHRRRFDVRYREDNAVESSHKPSG